MAEIDEAERARILAWLARREEINAQTKATLELSSSRMSPTSGSPGVPPEVDPATFEQVEEEFHRSRGRVKYESSEGRVRWLTPEEIALRKRARQKTKSNSAYYGPAVSVDRRRMTGLIFNLTVVVVGAALVYLVFR